MQALYLCDPCAVRMMKKAMNGRAPVYNGETVTGFCGLCNFRRNVTLRWYFVCPYCWNVIIAYQRGQAASKAVLDYWKRQVAPGFPDILLTETDPQYLSPYLRIRRSKNQAALDLRHLDFLAETLDGSGRRPLFHIEAKSGPSRISEMTKFQLDINDSNDIVAAVNNTGIPAYVFHAQLLYEYEPPTRRTLVGDMWFSDIWTLLEHRTAIRPRRGDQKYAGYYNLDAFQPIEEFTKQLKARRYRRLKRQILSRPLAMTRVMPPRTGRGNVRH